MRIMHIIGLAAASCLLLAACQSNSYKIEGCGDNLNDGDTVFISKYTSPQHYLDTAIVHDGKFVFKGHIDSMQICVIGDKNKTSNSLHFILEPGRIKIQISNNPFNASIGGTVNNDKWQSLTNEALPIGVKIMNLSTLVDRGHLSHEYNRELIDSIKVLNNSFSNIVERYVNENIDNEFGYILLKYYNKFFDKARLDRIHKRYATTHSKEK